MGSLHHVLKAQGVLQLLIVFSQSVGPIGFEKAAELVEHFGCS